VSADRPVVRETATVTVSEPVDGRRRRRAATGRRPASPVEGFTVDPRIWAAAKAALRPGERLKIVGPDLVITVNR